MWMNARTYGNGESRAKKVTGLLLGHAMFSPSQTKLNNSSRLFGLICGEREAFP